MAADDPTLTGEMVARARQFEAIVGDRATRWIVDPGDKACLLRDADDAAGSRILFLRETGKISMWITPRAPDPGVAQAFQLYFVSLGEEPRRVAVNAFDAVLWEEPLVKRPGAGIAIQADPKELIERYPAGFAVILAQGERPLFQDIVRPDVLAALPELRSCRGGR